MLPLKIIIGRHINFEVVTLTILIISMLLCCLAGVIQNYCPNQILKNIFRLLKTVMDFLEFLLDQTVGANTNLASVNLILARSKKHFQVQNFWRKIKLKIGTNSKMKMVKHTNIRIIAMDVSHVTHQVCMFRGCID